MKKILVALFGQEDAAAWSAMSGWRKVGVIYFILSLFLVCITDDAPAWFIVAEMANLAVAVWVAKCFGKTASTN